MRGRHQRVQGGQPVGGRRVEQVDAVAVQDVEEEHRKWLGRAGRGHIDGSAEPRRGDLEAVRPVIGPQRDRLAVGDQVVDRQRQRRLHHLGQPGGDVVQASGVDRDVVTGPVDLHPRTVQLRLENGCAAVTFERIGHTCRGLRQHRADRPADPQRERVQRRRSAGQARLPATAGRSPPSIAARCTAAAGIPAALATASAMMPASAPWRSSPPSSRSRKVCSVSVAAAKSPARSSARRACDPVPDTAPMSAKVASTPVTVSTGCDAGGGRDRSDAQPTPIWRWRSSPDSHDTMIGTNSGSARGAA